MVQAQQQRNMQAGVDSGKRGVIIHAIAEYIEGGKSDEYCIDFIERQGLGVHAFVSPSGLVIRTAPDNALCYHAKGFNTGYLGVEVMVGGVHTYESFLAKIRTDWVTPEQYKSVIDLLRDWRTEHNIKSVHDIRTHSMVDPERKADTGAGFRYEYVIGMVATQKEIADPKFAKQLVSIRRQMDYNARRF